MPLTNLVEGKSQAEAKNRYVEEFSFFLIVVLRVSINRPKHVHNVSMVHCHVGNTVFAHRRYHVSLAHVPTTNQDFHCLSNT